MKIIYCKLYIVFRKTLLYLLILEFQCYLLAFISCELIELTRRQGVSDAFKDSFPFAFDRSSEKVSTGEAN